MDINYKWSLTFAYRAEKTLLGIEPVDASPEIQRYCRRRIENNYGDIIKNSIPKELAPKVSKGVSDADYLEFLHDCAVQCDKELKDEKDRFISGLEGLPPDVLDVFLKADADVCTLKKSGDTAVLEMWQYGAPDLQRIVLKNAVGIEENKEYDIYYTDTRFRSSDGVQSFVFTTGSDEQLTVEFESVSAETEKRESIRANSFGQLTSPWQYLVNLAQSIKYKQLLSLDYLNESERAILPIINDLYAMQCAQTCTGYFVCEGKEFEQLRSLIKEYGFVELLPLTDKIINSGYSDENAQKAANRLVAKLNLRRYEPLWRRIYDKIAASQSEYKSVGEKAVGADLLNETRETVSRILHLRGYVGEYPDFRKDGEMNGIHIAESYGMTYFAGREKNVGYCIHCEEEERYGEVVVKFLCGTAFLSKCGEVKDAFSCTFNSKGVTFFNNISYSFGEDQNAALPQIVDIAVKKTELLKLTKEERKLVGGEDNLFGLFLFVFILMGGFFAVGMTLGMMLFSILLVLIVAGPGDIPGLFTAVPWLQLGLFAWIGFGGLMGLFMVIAKKK